MIMYNYIIVIPNSNSKTKQKKQLYKSSNTRTVMLIGITSNIKFNIIIQYTKQTIEVCLFSCLRICYVKIYFSINIYVLNFNMMFCITVFM